MQTVETKVVQNKKGEEVIVNVRDVDFYVENHGFTDPNAPKKKPGRPATKKQEEPVESTEE